ncbi:S8 family peptidase [Pararhodospirillum photometricum]|uniref:S8 family peptidase n=1 Tax=Pararhodospirillum photometricum TaxID=1084 RepID=UPI0012FF2B91|nr:S8 family serine peptidase [Pararhodospirillum photometricum]
MGNSEESSERPVKYYTRPRVAKIDKNAARRHYKSLKRKYLKKGIDLVLRGRRDPSPQSFDPATISIVIPPWHSPSGGGQGVAVQRSVGLSGGASLLSVKEQRRRTKQFLRESLGSLGWNGELRNSATMSPFPPVAAAGGAGVAALPKASGTIRWLKALDVFFLDNGSEAEKAALIKKGAVVLPNQVVRLNKPAARSLLPGVGPSDLWHLRQVNIGNAANRPTGKGEVVGVLDTGVEAKHSELEGRVVGFQKFSARGEKVAAEARDHDGHGTHVCALIAGRKCGIAPGAQLAVASVLTEKSSGGAFGYFAQILAGYDWLVELRKKGSYNLGVINISAGTQEYSNYLLASIQQARIADGILTVVAVGNEASLSATSSPGNYPGVVSVGATDQSDNVATFSNSGNPAAHPAERKPDLAAPGVEVVSAWLGGKFRRMSGTSMASPIVAGAAALLREQEGGDPDAVDVRLRTLVAPGTASPRSGAGRLDLSSL